MTARGRAPRRLGTFVAVVIASLALTGSVEAVAVGTGHPNPTGDRIAAGDATAYRYWSYWTVVDGTWVFATSGPAARAPQDGDVEGWRFARSTTTGDQPPRTSAALAFDRACGSTPAATDPAGSGSGSGTVRVAIVIDPGTPDDAPAGQAPAQPRMACAVVAAGASSAQALSSTSDVRAEQGFVCALDGYPMGECAPIVTGSRPPAARSSASPSTAPLDVFASQPVDPAPVDQSPVDQSPVDADPVASGPAAPSTSPAPMVITITLVLGALAAALIISRHRRGSR